MLVWLVSNPGIDYFEVPVALAGTIVVLAVVLVSGLTGVISRRGSFLVCAGLLALLTAAVTIFGRAQSPSNPLFRIRFVLSQSALANRVAAETEPVTTQGPQWIGLFHVARIERLDNEVRFITGMCGVVDQCGLVFRLVPPTQVHRKERLRRLSGSWYHLYDVF